ncbi:hypothetical protein ACQF4J_00030 [Streptomyces sp. C1-1]|uniref:hypothetical protein n=1 Tax=Streptomyces sp. C1-1 TaxID=3231173 RepID=UPI003CFE2BCA
MDSQGLTPRQVIGRLERAFQRVTGWAVRVEGGDGAQAVAAGALVAGALPGSPIVIDPDDGPGEPLPELPARLRRLAGRALERVVGDGSDLSACCGTRPWVRRP